MADARPNPWPLRALLALLAAAVWSAVAWQYTRVTAVVEDQVPPDQAPGPAVVEAREAGRFVPPARDPFLPLLSSAPAPVRADSVALLRTPRPADSLATTAPPRVRRTPPRTTYDDVFGNTAPPLVAAAPTDDAPDLVFRGVVGDRALLEGADGRTVLLREGDQIDGVTLSRISGEFVTVLKAGETFVVFPD